MEQIFLTGILREMADRRESASAVPTVMRGTVPLARKIMAVMESTYSSTWFVILFMWSLRSPVSANPGVSRMRTWEEVMNIHHVHKRQVLTTMPFLLVNS
jgi:hypothetical protein